MRQQRQDRASPRGEWPNRRRPRLVTHAIDMIDTALLACFVATLLASAVAVATQLRTLQMGPPVGQILRFGPYAQPGPIWRIDAVRSIDRRRCVLQPTVMASAHGSMVVEQRLGDGRSYQAHWVGGPTSDGDGNCGNAVDLTIELPAMQTLVNADALARHFFLGF